MVDENARASAPFPRGTLAKCATELLTVCAWYLISQLAYAATRQLPMQEAGLIAPIDDPIDDLQDALTDDLEPVLQKAVKRAS